MRRKHYKQASMLAHMRDAQKAIVQAEYSLLRAGHGGCQGMAHELAELSDLLASYINANLIDDLDIPATDIDHQLKLERARRNVAEYLNMLKVEEEYRNG